MPNAKYVTGNFVVESAFAELTKRDVEAIQVLSCKTKAIHF